MRRPPLAVIAALGTFLGGGAGGGLHAQEPGEESPERPQGRELRGQEQAAPETGTRAEEGAPGGPPFFEWSRATGSWGGTRTWLEENGILPEVLLTTDASVVASGGADPGGTALRALLDATFTVDTERAFGLAGGTFFADLEVQRGDDGSTDTGDLQVYSNIDGEDRTQLAKIWYEHELFERTLWVKVGKIDANSEFAYVEHGFRFINSSFGFSPTILAFPSYPDAAFGGLVFLQMKRGAYAGAGVFDGATHAGMPTGSRGPSTLFGSPSDLFAIGEAGVQWRSEEDERPGRVGVGVWRHTGEFPRFDGGTEDGTGGFYVVVDQTVWRSAVGDGARREIGAFFQYGWADAEVSGIDHHVGGGVAWTGPFESRPSDAVGIGFTYASFSSVPGAGLRGDGELAIELFYTIQATPFLSVKPDVQWIRNPGGNDFDDALVFTLRTAVTF